MDEEKRKKRKKKETARVLMALIPCRKQNPQKLILFIRREVYIEDKEQGG